MVNFYICVDQYKKRSTYVYELVYGDRKRIFKRSDLPFIHEALNAWLEQRGQLRVGLELEKQYCLSVDPSELEHLIYVLETGTNKKKVALADGLDRTVYGVYLSYSYRCLSEFYQHWLTPNDVTLAMFEQLSQDVLETPYADEPEDYEVRHGKVAFHLNHGTSHAMRSVTLFNFIIHFLNIYGHKGNESCQAIQQMAQEEKACLTLAVFLFRSGRTNELGWSSDRSYSPRSAAIFTQIALDLGHDAPLVSAMASSFDFECSIDLTRSFLDKNIEDSNKQVRLYQKILHVTHTCDLTRCCSSKDYLLEVLSQELSILLTGDKDIKELLDCILDFSEKLCLETGAPIAYEHHAPNRRFFGNFYKAVDVSTDVAKTCARLEVLMHEEIGLCRNRLSQTAPAKRVA